MTRYEAAAANYANADRYVTETALELAARVSAYAGPDSVFESPMIAPAITNYRNAVARRQNAIDDMLAARIAAVVKGAEASDEVELIAKDHARANRPTCRDCGAPLESSRDGWVDARSGDEGGTFDICPARYDAETDLNRGHRA